MSAPVPVSPQVDSVQTWLEAEPADDPVVDLAQWRVHFTVLADPGLSDAARQGWLEQFESRILDVCERFIPHLLTAALPLPRDLHVASVELVAALLDVSAAFQTAVDSLRDRWVLGSRSDVASLAGRALRLVNESYRVVCMSGAAVPAGLWRRAYALMMAAGLPDASTEATPEALARGASFQFKRLVALAAVQPESLTARELAWVYDYLEIVAALGRLASEPVQPESSAFWMDTSGDGAPVAAVRRLPPLGDGLLHFSALAMARRAGEQIEWLETRITDAYTTGEERAGALLEPDVSGLPLGLTALEALSLLRRMRDRWSTPPARTNARRAHQYSVQVCAGLRDMWRMRRHGGEAVKLDEWMVCNESPGGFAIMSVEGIAGGLSAGMALALRRDASQPWSICIVRWIRAERPDQAEVGLQVIAHACTPVAIAFRGGEARATTPALVLPPMAGVRSNPAILVAAGTYSSRRFMLVHEGEHLYVAQARVLSLDMQTASVELFQYEIDAYPI